jgi:cell division protein ZapA
MLRLAKRPSAGQRCFVSIRGIAPRTVVDGQWRPPSDRRSYDPRGAYVKIEIFDQFYNLNTEQGPEYVQQLGDYVDSKMRAVSAAARTVDSLKVAVLAALNIADELFAARKQLDETEGPLRQRQDELEGPLRERVEKCLILVEKALEASN